MNELTTRSQLKVLGLVLLVHGVVGALVFRFGTDLQDEGLLIAWGTRLLKGQLPYTDFYMVQAPGTFYVQAVLVKIFGPSLIAGRVFKQLQALALIVLAYKAVERASHNQKAALCAAIATAIFSAAHHFRLPWYSTDACMCVLAALWAGSAAVHEQALRNYFLAGAWLGAATLFKQNHGVFGLAAMGPLLVLSSASYTPQGKLLRACICAFSILSGFALPLCSYLIYYSSAGGSLQLLWLNSFVWASEAKDFESSLQTLLYPLQVFSLVSKKDWVLPAAAAAFTLGVFVSLSRRPAPAVRWLGAVLAASVAALGPDVLVRVYILCFINLLVFAVAALSVLDAWALRNDPASKQTSAACCMVALVAAANVYGGTIPGGGWGRMVETWTGTLMVAGVAAHLITQSPATSPWWRRHAWIAPRELGFGLAAVSLVVSLGLLAKNQAYRPGLDVPLSAMDGHPQHAGWQGLKGDSFFVKETDELIAQLSALPDVAKQNVYVFPLNCAIYPLSGASNPTQFDSHQVDFLAPSRFDEVLRQLTQTMPAAIVWQRRPNASFGVGAEEVESWVRPELRAAVQKFLHDNYRLERSWNYYELWTPRADS